MQDGARAAGDVHTEPDAAHHLAHDPSLLHNVDNAEGHDQDGHKQVRHSQRTDKIVCRVVQFACDDDGSDD